MESYIWRKKFGYWINLFLDDAEIFIAITKIKLENFII